MAPAASIEALPVLGVGRSGPWDGTDASDELEAMIIL